MDVPISWNNERETILSMLVVPQLAWPILFGENHLPATKALVDQPTHLLFNPKLCLRGISRRDVYAVVGAHSAWYQSPEWTFRLAISASYFHPSRTH